MSYRKITVKQKAAYWAAFQSACFNMGLTGREEKDYYRHRAMREECGNESINDLNATGDYDKVMHRFYVDAGDFEQAAKYAVADIHRVAMLIKIECCQIMQLPGSSDAEAQRYLGGVLDQSRIANGRHTDTGTYWLDVAPDNLTKLLAILDTYRRRLLRRIIDRGVVDNLTFFPGHRYTASPYTRTAVASGYYANLPDMTVNVR